MVAPDTDSEPTHRGRTLLAAVVLAVLVSFLVIPGVTLAVTTLTWRSPLAVPAVPFAVLTMVPGILLGLAALATMLPPGRTP